jgi:hypothetical protein
LTSAVTAAQTTLPVGDLSKLPVPGSAGIYGLGSWPTPLYLRLGTEYVSYTGTTGTTGLGSVTGVVRGINSTAAPHALATPVEVARPNHAIQVILGRPISKGLLISNIDGQFDARPALTIGANNMGQPTDPGNRLTMHMNGNVETLGTISTPHLVGFGAAPGVAAGAGAGVASGGSVTLNGSDLGGSITVATGSAPAAAQPIATVTFAQPYAGLPASVLFAPANFAAASLALAARPWVDAAQVSPSGFVVRAGTTPLAASTGYQFYYGVIG